MTDSNGANDDNEMLYLKLTDKHGQLNCILSINKNYIFSITHNLIMIKVIISHLLQSYTVGYVMY